MKYILHFKALLVLLVSSAALADDHRGPPLWQLVAAEAGLPATVALYLPVNTHWPTLTGVTIPGVTLRDQLIISYINQVHVRIDEPDAVPVVFDTALADVHFEVNEVDVGQVEVHWLRQHANPPIMFLRQVALNSHPMVLAFMVQNTSDVSVELTDFRYAPAALSTGQLLVSREVSSLEGQIDIDLPYMFDPEQPFDESTWEGIPFSRFNFSEGSLTMKPGDKLVLVVGGEGMTDASLFHTDHTLEWAPWLEYSYAGQDWQLLLFRQRPGN